MFPGDCSPALLRVCLHWGPYYAITPPPPLTAGHCPHWKPWSRCLRFLPVVPWEIFTSSHGKFFYLKCKMLLGWLWKWFLISRKVHKYWWFQGYTAGMERVAGTFSMVRNPLPLSNIADVIHIGMKGQISLFNIGIKKHVELNVKESHRIHWKSHGHSTVAKPYHHPKTCAADQWKEVRNSSEFLLVTGTSINLKINIMAALFPLRNHSPTPYKHWSDPDNSGLLKGYEL